MAENTTQDEGLTSTDVAKQQTKMINTLVDVLQQQGMDRPQQIVYATPAEPAAKPPNYVLYIGLIIAALIYFKR